MSRLTLQQRTAAVKHFYQSNNNAAEAARRLAAQFSLPVPQGRNVKSIVEKFEETGSVSDLPKPGRRKSATDADQQAAIIQALQDSPQKSSRQLSRELGISRSSVLRILHGRGMRPYIPRLIHALHDGDDDRRIQFAEEILYTS